MSKMSDEQDNAAQIAYWNERAGLIWTEFQQRLDTLFEPITEAALKAAAPAPNEQVIDIGCGCGATLLRLADKVGAHGLVTGYDVSEPMSARARERIAAAGLANTSVLVSDAATHVFPPGATDLLFSRFGVMFFADPVAAFNNLHRAMRSGGRLLCAVWRPLAENPWFMVPLEAARPLVPPQPEADPNAPGPFAFADANQTTDMLQAAGWQDVKFSRHDVSMCFAPAGELDQAVDFAMRVGPLTRILAEVQPDLRLRVRQAIMTAIKPYDGPSGINLTGSIWLISARA